MKPNPYDLARRAWRRVYGYPVEESKQDRSGWLEGWVHGYESGKRSRRKKANG